MVVSEAAVPAGGDAAGVPAADAERYAGSAERSSVR